ncbi:pantoate--beta-alanine ligase [Bdellovibrio sp. HCB337]|uniref:pantoate--beta-alanine ligase n=1 Tax=Bdellovibrio sp. HCB337 TaxID=3394358 RepID=UPI0039A6D459
MTRVIRSPQEFKQWRRDQAGMTVGFVPTMGALHAGHESLLKRSRDECEISVLSIFVNPTQFNDPKDFEKYPMTWEQDLAIAEANGVDVVFYPRPEEMYSDGYHYKVTEDEFSKVLCGASRPGHFDGVLSVVMRLFNVVAPTKSYFGEKDFQQLTLIQGMVRAYFMDLIIVPVPTMREADGLAMSSRNLRLTPEQRAKAPAIYKTIKTAKSAAEAVASLTEQGFKVDYVTDLKGRRFAAAFLGDVRLIDNVQI